MNTLCAVIDVSHLVVIMQVSRWGRSNIVHVLNDAISGVGAALIFHFFLHYSFCNLQTSPGFTVSNMQNNAFVTIRIFAKSLPSPVRFNSTRPSCSKTEFILGRRWLVTVIQKLWIHPNLCASPSGKLPFSILDARFGNSEAQSITYLSADTGASPVENSG